MLVPAMAFAVSAAYVYASPPATSVGHTLVTSAHGASIASIYLAAMSVFWTNRANPEFQKPFLTALLVPVILIIVSLVAFRGRKSIHFLQIFNVLFLAWTFFIGSMAVTGNWL